MKEKTYDQPCLLMRATIRLVKETGVDETTIRTHVPTAWLQKLIAGKFRNPSVNRVVHVYEHLSKTKLKV
jgi:hypothetical protein